MPIPISKDCPEPLGRILSYPLHYSTKRNIYQDASKDAHQINSSIKRIASKTHLEFSSASSIEDSYIKVGDKNDKHRDQEPRKNNGDKNDHSTASACGSRHILRSNSDVIPKFSVLVQTILYQKSRRPQPLRLQD